MTTSSGQCAGNGCDEASRPPILQKEIPEGHALNAVQIFAGQRRREALLVLLRRTSGRIRTLINGN
ncbi:MAG: hypothetical protein ACHQ4F_09650 [Candidatus Dormibacteria bacterium]